MSKKEKQEENIEKDILEDLKIVSGLTSVNYLQTKEKGIYVWGTPLGSSFEEHYKLIDFLKSKTHETEEIRKKQVEEEEKKKEEEKKEID